MMYRKTAVAVLLAGAWLLVKADSKFDALIESKQYKQAIEYAEENIPLSSRTSGILLKMGRAYEELGFVEKALASYLVSWRMQPKNYDAMLGAAKIHNRLNQPENAMTMAQKALEQNFTSEASWEYAQACIALNRADEAKKALEKVIETDPKNSVANHALGNIYYGDRQYAKAVPLLQIVARARRKDADILYKLGRSLVETQELKEGVNYLERALKYNALFGQARLDLARAYYGLGKYDDAAKAYSQVPAKIRKSAEDHFKHAVALEKTQGLNQAIGLYRSAVKMFGASTSKEALFSRAMVSRYELGHQKHAEALPHLQFIYRADTEAKVVPDIYSLLANAHEGMKSLSKAISILEIAITKDSKNIEAYARLADLYQRNQAPKKAQKTYETLMALKPDDPQVYLALGQYNLNAKQYEKALEYLTKSKELHQSTEAFDGIARSAFALKKWDTALDAAESAVARNPKAWQSCVVAYKVLMHQEQFGLAGRYLEKLVEKEPSNTQYWIDLAICYEQARARPKLAKADERIIKLDRRNVDARLRHAQYCAGHGNVSQAIALYKELTLLIPKNEEVFRSLVQLNKQQGNKSQGIKYLKRLLALTPKDAVGYRDLGDLLYDQKRYDEALAAYRKAIQIDPKIKGFYKRYAEIVIAKGQHAEVIRALNKVIKAGEADASTYTTLGMIYQKQGHYKKALDTYKTGLQMNPKNLDVLTAVGECYAKLGDLRNAIINLEQVVMMNPDADREYKVLGELYQNQNKTKQALRAFQKYLEKHGTDSQAAKMVGKDLYDKKKYQEAEKFLSMVKGKEAKEFYHLMALGECYYYNKKYDNAVSIFKGLLHRNPKLSNRKKILRMLAECYEKTNKPRNAAATYAQYAAMQRVRDPEASYKAGLLNEKFNRKEAIGIYLANTKKFSKDHRNYYRLYVLYCTHSSTRQKAITMLKKAASLVDTIPDVYLKLAKLYGKLGKTENELNAYKRHLEKNPQDIETNKRIGAILFKKGNLSEGLIYLEMAIAMAPKDIEIIGLLAEGYVKTNRTQKAIDLLEQGKRLKGNDPEAAMRVAELYGKVGQHDKAIEEMEEVLKYKRDKGYLQKYAEMLYANGDYKKAKNAIEDIRLSAPEDIDALMLLGRIQRAQKKNKQAVETYKEVTSINLRYAPAYFELAKTYLALNSILRAELFYKRTLERDRSHAGAEYGLAKIARMRKQKGEYIKHLERARKLAPYNKTYAEELRRVRTK